MKTANVVLLTFGILFVGPAAAEPLAARRPVRALPPAQRFFIFNALAPQTILPLPAPPPRASTGPRQYLPQETDGLSRNLDDCAKYGCIDDGGG